MTTRDSNGRTGRAAALLALLLLAVAGGALFGVLSWLDRPEPAPAETERTAPAEEELLEPDAEVPFDRILVDGDEYRLIVECPRRWGVDAAEDRREIVRVEEALGRCARFAGGRMRELYPESAGKRIRVELDLSFAPPAPVRARLAAAAGGAHGILVRGRPLDAG